jgi:hypothetical protein
MGYETKRRGLQMGCLSSDNLKEKAEALPPPTSSPSERQIADLHCSFYLVNRPGSSSGGFTVCMSNLAQNKELRRAMIVMAIACGMEKGRRVATWNEIFDV